MGKKYGTMKKLWFYMEKAMVLWKKLWYYGWNYEKIMIPETLEL